MSLIRDSYSQHREDAFIWQILQRYNLEGSVYIDIGANHPTDISNTYLLYRNGLRGLVVEPNRELLNLFSRFRKGDILLPIGCSNINAVMPFHVSKTPVVSSFEAESAVNVYRTEYLPVMRADEAFSRFSFSFVNLFSIDVEGLNKEVLEGATETIKRSLIVCIEFDSPEEKKEIIQIMGEGFELLQTFGCNMIFLNSLLAAKKLKQ